MIIALNVVDLNGPKMNGYSADSNTNKQVGFPF